MELNCREQNPHKKVARPGTMELGRYLRNLHDCNLVADLKQGIQPFQFRQRTLFHCNFILIKAIHFPPINKVCGSSITSKQKKAQCLFFFNSPNIKKRPMREKLPYAFNSSKRLNRRRQGFLGVPERAKIRMLTCHLLEFKLFFLGHCLFMVMQEMIPALI